MESSPAPAPAAVAVRTVDVKPLHEFRFEVALGTTTKIQLLSGTAECFGHELVSEREYSFTGVNSCIFTWHGCRLQVDGQCHSYIADETPMNMYVNSHAILQGFRNQARQTGGVGPKVMVVGATDSGKSSLCTLLINYAARMGEVVNFVDLDIGQGSITVPGMLAAASINRPIDIHEGLSQSVPLVYFYGGVTPSENAKLYKFQMQNLANQVLQRVQEDPEARPGGMIINTCGWVDGQGYELLLDSIDIFNPDFVLVIAHERLYSDLSQHVRTNNKPGVNIVKMAKSGGVVVRDPTYRRKGRTSKIREYFYGKINDLHPHTTVLDFREIQVFRIGTGSLAPLTALPIGAEPSADPIKVQTVIPSVDLLHSILGVSYADGQDKVLESNIAGYVYVTDVNVDKKKLTVLAPCSGQLPSKVLIAGSLKWIEA